MLEKMIAHHYLEQSRKIDAGGMNFHDINQGNHSVDYCIPNLKIKFIAVSFDQLFRGGENQSFAHCSIKQGEIFPAIKNNFNHRPSQTERMKFNYENKQRLKICSELLTCECF